MTDQLPIDDLVECVNRELKLRKRVYPRWIDDGRMTQKKSDHEIRCMAAILALLQREQQKEQLL